MARSWNRIKSDAILELRNRSDIATRVEQWLREAALEVAYGYRFYELEKSVLFTLGVSMEEITFAQAGASDLKHIFSLRDMTNNRKVRPSGFRYIDGLTSRTGVPNTYCRFGDALLFDSSPVTTGINYRLRYRKKLPDIVFSDNDAPITPEEWDEVIRLKAVARGFPALFEAEQGEIYEARAMRLIESLPIDEVVEVEDQDFGLTPRKG